MGNTTRRAFLIRGASAVAASAFSGIGVSSAVTVKPNLRLIPSTGESVPMVGMGSWITFDVDGFAKPMATRVEVLRKFFTMGGGLIDSSPMYGSSEKVIGHCLRQLRPTPNLFAATKVWTYGTRAGIAEMEQSRQLWGVPKFDLMQIHNLLDWERHLETLKAWRSEGRIRYLGITTSHGRRHREIRNILEREPIDFVQLTYNIADREAERYLLPLAAEKGIAVIANRPFQRRGLFRGVAGHQIPAWSREFECANWAQFFLKYILSNPAVTCAIPATSQVEHMAENMGAAYGALPDNRQRQQMVAHLKQL